MFGFPFRKKEENMCPQDEAYAIYRKPAPPSCSIQTFLPQLKYCLINPCRATKLSQSYRVQGLLIHDLLTKISGVTELALRHLVERGFARTKLQTCGLMCSGVWLQQFSGIVLLRREVLQPDECSNYVVSLGKWWRLTHYWCSWVLHGMAVLLQWCTVRQDLTPSWI